MTKLADSSALLTNQQNAADELADQRKWSELLASLLVARELSIEDTSWAMQRIMTGKATPAQLSAFAVLLRAKGETVGEITGLVEAMLATAVPLKVTTRAVDVVGTGGDRAHTVNISTMAALVAAGAGAAVVKHGNRAASSSCGTADVLAELGVIIDLPADGVLDCVNQVGIGFCFAPAFHGGLKHAAAVRKQIGVPTVFNYLGPLVNPATPAAQAVGCADARMAPLMAGVLADRGTTSLVFRGDDGLDELTTTTTSTVWVVRDGVVEQSTVDPTELGIPFGATTDLRGADPAFNAKVVRDVLAGERHPARNAVLLNAAAALAAYHGLQAPLRDSLQAGLVAATEAIDNGAALHVLDRWIAHSQRVQGE